MAPEDHSDRPMLLKIEEAAKLLHISRSQAYRLTGSGVLPSVKIGASRRVRRADLERYINALGDDDEEPPTYLRLTR